MGKLFDWIVGATFDMQIKNGDFVMGESTLQNQQFLLLAEKGEYKQHPTTGVGLVNSIEEDKTGAELEADIQSNFEADGMTITKLKVKSFDDIQIEAQYGNDSDNG